MTSTRLAVATLAVFLLALVPALTSASTIWIESGDAGRLPGSAQVVSGSGSLTEIQGSMNDLAIPQGTGNDADMYLISIVDPTSFSALASAAGNNLQLFLFDSSGFGVAFSDNVATAVFPFFDPDPLLTDAFVSSAGLYYLAVSRFDRDPTSAGSEIWNDLPSTVERAPDGPAALGAIDGWNGTQLSFISPSYSIYLTGAEFVSTAPVPEPATLLLLSTGLTAAGVRRRMKKRG